MCCEYCYDCECKIRLSCIRFACIYSVKMTDMIFQIHYLIVNCFEKPGRFQAMKRYDRHDDSVIK